MTHAFYATCLFINCSCACICVLVGAADVAIFCAFMAALTALGWAVDR